MYAIIEDGSRQYRVEEGGLVIIDHREIAAGARLELTKVLLLSSGGASIHFAGFDEDASTYTNESGIAVAPRIRPVGANGPVDIRVTASHAGDFANCVLHQINLGIEGEGNRENELTIVRLPSMRSPESRPDGPSDFLVRVEDAKGNPIPSAKVLCVLLRVIGGGKTEELSRITLTTGQNGEVVSTISKQSAKSHYEFVVEAFENGRRATRYFPIK